VCGLCGVLASEHWADAGAGRRGRVFRAAVLDRVLAYFGLSLTEWSGRYVVRDLKGRSEVVEDLGAVWVVAERLAGRALDPLDPGLVAALGGAVSRGA
jgi:hypothetical protein